MPPPQHARARAVGLVTGRHARAPSSHSQWPASPGSPSRGRAAGGGGAPDLRRPSQRRAAPPPGTPFRHPHGAQRRPARARAVGPVLGPQARTDRTRDTRVAEPWLPATGDGRPGEGQRLTPDAPDNGGRPSPPGTAPHHPHGTQPPQGMQAKGTVLGPHTHTPAPTARGWRSPTARPVGGQSGEGQRLISDAPHNGGRHPPRGRPSATPTSSNAGPQGRMLWGWCWVPTPRPHRPHPGHTGRRTPAARSRGRAAGRGTARDTRRPPQRWQASPDCRPTGRAVGVRHPRAVGAGVWVWGPNNVPLACMPCGGCGPRGWWGAVPGGADRLTSDAPQKRWKAPPPRTPFRHPHSEQRRPARAHALGLVLGSTPAPTAPGTHGSRNPGCPLQRTGVHGRDSA